MVPPSKPRPRRRGLLLAGLAPLLGPSLVACADSGLGARGDGSPARLAFRPPRRPGSQRRTGFLELPSPHGGDPAHALLPAAPPRGLRLVVMLHGANGHPRRALGFLRPYAEARGLALLAPKSADATWDVIRGRAGPDVAALDALLEEVSRLAPVTSYAVGGFSDGASCALTLGLANGDLFDSVVAFSPGFHAAEDRRGEPRFFFSHGVQDPVLPIDRCSRPLVSELREDGYDVTFEEFEGGHQVPPAIRRRAAEWLTAT